MFQKREALVGQVHNRKATFVREADSKDNTHTFVMVSEDNGGMRYDWYSGESYEERLDISGGSFGSLNTFFKDHNRSVDSAIGRIENVRVDGGTIKGEVTFGSGEDEQSVYRKYDEGILTDVSIGYRINKYEVEEREGEADVVTVTDYDIFELSAVGIGFDGGAKIERSITLEDEAEVMARVETLEARFGISNKESE